MAEEKSGFVRGVLADAQTEFKKLAAKGLAVGAMTVLGGIMGSLAVWLRGTNDLERGMLWGSAATLLTLTLLLLLLGGLRRYKSRKQVAIPVPTPETVPQEPVDRLRELYSFWGPTVQFACEALFADIYLLGMKGSDDKRAIAILIHENIGRKCLEDKEALDIRFQNLPNPLTSADFDRLMEHLNSVINSRYQVLAGWLLTAGKSILGEDRLLLSDWYETLYRRHQEATAELRRVRGRPYIGGIASWHRTLETLLPPPTKLESRPEPSDPVPSTPPG